MVNEGDDTLSYISNGTWPLRIQCLGTFRLPDKIYCFHGYNDTDVSFPVYCLAVLLCRIPSYIKRNHFHLQNNVSARLFAQENWLYEYHAKFQVGSGVLWSKVFNFIVWNYNKRGQEKWFWNTDALDLCLCNFFIIIVFFVVIILICLWYLLILCMLFTADVNKISQVMHQNKKN